MSDSRVHRRLTQSDAKQSASPAWKRKTGFQLPPDVSYEKQRLSDAWAYVFRHRVLGELGRILLQELDDGRCHISCEVVGDPSDPMTMQRWKVYVGARWPSDPFEAGLSTYGRADSVAKEPGRIRRLVFANGLRFSCKNLTSKCTSLRFTCNRHSESGIAVKS